MSAVAHEHRWSLLRVSIAVAIGLAVALMAWSALAQSPGRHQGTIVSVSEALLILEVESINYTIHWDHETIVTLNGEVVEMTKLRAGDGASVNFRRAEDGVLLATSVEATRA